MVEILTDEMKESGARLLQEMEAAGMRPEAAFWLYDPEREEWELTLADPSVADGSMDKYRRIQQLLLQHPEKFKELPLHHIALVKPTSPVVKGLRRGLGDGRDVSGLRVRNAYYGTYIEGAYIYRLN